MEVKEIVINGKSYIPKQAIDNLGICNDCAIKEVCMGKEEDVFEMCGKYLPFGYNFQLNNKLNHTTNTKFYKFSSGTVFNINYIKNIVDISYVELCMEEPNKYGFSIFMTNFVVFVRFKTKTIANRERNKFIKFIEEYGN